jgi:HSP20 family molecular chaperone IbpA
MKIKFCPNCGTAVQPPLSICSECGLDTAKFEKPAFNRASNNDLREELKNFIENFVESNSDLIKDLAAKVEKGEGFEKGMFFAVEMKGEKPIIKSGDVKDFEKIFKTAPTLTPFHKIFSGKETEFKEITPEIFEGPMGRRVTFKLPGVKNQDDVIVNLIENGLEIIGKTEDQIYFSKTQMTDPFQIINSSLVDETFIINIT